MPTLATVARKSFNKFTAKIDSPIGYFMSPLLIKSLHTLCDQYLDHMLVNLNKMVWSELYKILSFLTKYD